MLSHVNQSCVVTPAAADEGFDRLADGMLVGLLMDHVPLRRILSLCRRARRMDPRFLRRMARLTGGALMRGSAKYARRILPSRRGA
jgi:hypothetical protein